MYQKLSLHLIGTIVKMLAFIYIFRSGFERDAEW